MYRSECSSLWVRNMNSNWITVWQAQHFPTYNPKAVLGISRRDSVTNQSVYSQTQARPLSSEVKRKLRFPWPLTSSRHGGSYQQIRLVCTLCRETKCWLAKTFVFAIYLKGHYGRLHSTDGAEILHVTEDRDYWRHLVAACRDNPNWPADELIYK